MRCSWSVCLAKELRIPCQTGVFSVDIQFTQKELSDYLSDVFWIELLKASNAGLRRHKRHFLAKPENVPFYTLQTNIL